MKIHGKLASVSFVSITPTLLKSDRSPLDGRAVAVTPTNPRPLGNSVRSDRLNLIYFTGLAAAYLLPFMRILLPSSNEGTLIVGAVRILHGEVFARDFFEVMGPGTFYILALLFKVFGATFLVTRIWLFFTSMGTGLCLYFISRRVCPRHAQLPSIVLAGTYFGMQWPSISHHVDGDFFALITVVTLLAWQDQQKSILLYMAGVLAGTTGCVHQSKGLFLVLAIGTWICLKGLSGRSSYGSLGRFVIGAMSIPLIAILYFWKLDALHSLIYVNFTWPATHYGAVNRVPYAFGLMEQYWQHWAVIPGLNGSWTVVVASILIVPFMFIAVTPGVVVVGTLRQFRSPDPAVLLCALGGTAMWLSELHRMDIYHLVFGCPLLLVVCIRTLGNIQLQPAEVGLQILGVCTVTLMAVNLFQVAVATSAQTKVGRVGLLKPDPVLTFMQTKLQTGDTVFFYPYCPIYYFLTGAKNPSRYSILVYGYNTPDEFADAVQSLERQRTEYVVWDSNFETRTFSAVFPKTTLPHQDQQVMEAYLKSKYIQIADVSGYLIMQRRR